MDEPIFNELWQNLWDFANANGNITLTAQQARELFDHISRDVHTGQKRLIENLLRSVGELKIDDLYNGIQKMGKNATHTGPISQARFDGFNVAKGFLIDILNTELLKK